VLESVPNIENNWVGLSKIQPTHEFRRVRVNEQAVVEFIDKDSELTAEQFTYIGLAGVNDHQIFWESMRSGGLEAVNLGEVYGLIALIDKSITTFNFTWFDIGSRSGLENARYNIQSTFKPNLLDKEDEAIWFIGDRVIKFSTDSSFINNRVQRAKALADYVPEIMFAAHNMYLYAKVEGQVLSSVVNQAVFQNFLTYLEGFFDQPIESTFTTKEFNEKCYGFYHDKTLERVEQYLTRFNLTDGVVCVNGRKIMPIFNQLENLDWESICNGIPSNFHGDLHFENILVQPNESFKFLDWRQNFAGCLDLGDRYYDLAKLLHGMIVPHQSVHDEQYSISLEGQNTTIDIRIPGEYELIRKSYWEWLTINNFNVGKVYNLTALVFLNIAALHHEPYCHFLYHLGRYMLDKGIDENYEGTLPNVYPNVSHYIKDQKL
jgi:thiamine kinase-like enzyme